MSRYLIFPVKMLHRICFLQLPILLAIIDIWQVWCGIIADGVHTHPTSIRIAYKTNFKSLVLVTDAILAMGYKDGKYQFGQQEIEVRGDQAWVAGTSTLTGSVATMQRCVTKFLKYVKPPSLRSSKSFKKRTQIWIKNKTHFFLMQVLEVQPSWSPRSCLPSPCTSSWNWEKEGNPWCKSSKILITVNCTPKVGADADFILLEPNSLEVCSTWIAGQCVYQQDSKKI